MSGEKTRPTMTVRAAADLLDVHENTIRNYIREGLIEAFEMPHGFRRPYADSVLSLVPDSERDVATFRRLMLSKAERLERDAAALRRAIAALDASEAARVGEVGRTQDG